MIIERNTACGKVKGIQREFCNAYLGIPYAKAERFAYAKEVTQFEGEIDGTVYGASCPQTRTYYPHMEVPERAFYFHEFRKDVTFRYDEDCLNLNIFTPVEEGRYPVLVYIHGGGFNSGANCEQPFDTDVYTKQGVILVTINYRVGVLGYLCAEKLNEENGREGNFGLDDQYTALCWIKKNIKDYGGDPENITLMGQSAGAMSIQYLCLCEKCRGLFQRVIMLSGAGEFPSFVSPKKAEEVREYWQDYLSICGVSDVEELKTLSLDRMFAAIETIKAKRKDNLRNTMPVIDGVLLTDSIHARIQNPVVKDCMVGYTNNDMYTFVFVKSGKDYATRMNGYQFFFDMDAPGDNNLAFHSSDLRYIFGCLKDSWRPYGAYDEEVSKTMVCYVANYVKTGDPNGEGLPEWKRGKAPLCIGETIGMGRVNWWKVIRNTFRGDPK